MNYKLLKSKKFRAAILGSVSSILTFMVSKYGLELDVTETMTLVTSILTPFLIYIGAEGYSEQSAKAAVEENKARKDISNQVLDKIGGDIKP